MVLTAFSELEWMQCEPWAHASEPRPWSLLPRSDMRTSCWLAFCSYLARFVSCLVFFVFFLRHFRALFHALCYSLNVWASSQINCHALVATRFWEAGRESLPKRRLSLDAGQGARMHVWPCVSELYVKNALHTESNWNIAWLFFFDIVYFALFLMYSTFQDDRKVRE